MISSANNSYNKHIMTTAITLEDRNGRSFWGKRLSSDREILRKLITMSRTVYTDKYSYAHIPDGENGNFIIADKNKVLESDSLYWTEIGDIPEETDQLIVFRWNRNYGADRFYNPLDHGWKMISSEDFPGYSHDKITMETYRK